MPPIHVAFLLFPNVTQLDLTGPAPEAARPVTPRPDGGMPLTVAPA